MISPYEILDELRKPSPPKLTLMEKCKKIAEHEYSTLSVEQLQRMYIHARTIILAREPSNNCIEAMYYATLPMEDRK